MVQVDIRTAGLAALSRPIYFTAEAAHGKGHSAWNKDVYRMPGAYVESKSTDDNLLNLD